LFLDLQGHWRLTDPRGRSCEIVMSFFSPRVSRTADCLVLGSSLAQIRNWTLSESTLQLRGGRDEVLLSFDTSNLDDLKGIDLAAGFQMTRLDADPIEPSEWEGPWRLSNPGCELFLSMRLRRIGPDALDRVRVPHQVSLASDCLSPTDQNVLQFSPEYAGGPAVVLPPWTGWHTEGHTIIFHDDSGRRTIFTPKGDGAWEAQLMRGEYPPIRVRLERGRR
jgi:hypothetical protein